MDMDIDPKVRALLGGLGLVAIREGLAKEAETLFLGLAALDETRAGPAIGLAQAYMANDKHAEAIGVLLEPARRDPEAACYLGLAHWLKGNREEAMAIWTPIAAGEGYAAETARSFIEAKEKL